MESVSDYKKKYVVEEAESVLIPKINLRNSEEVEVENKAMMESKGSFLHKIKEKISKPAFFRRKTSQVNSGENRQNQKKSKIKIVRWVALVILVIFIPILIQSFFVFRVYRDGIALKSAVEKLVSSSKSQDLESVKNEISNTRTCLNVFNNSYKKISWFGVLPFVGKYVDDGQHAIRAGFQGLDLLETVLGVVEPYADIVGFDKSQDKSSKPSETTQDKLDFIVKTLPDLVPKADELVGKIALIEKEIDEVNPDDYPITFSGHEVREKIRKAVNLIDMAFDMIKNGKPLLEISPYLIGVDGERTYLVVFQNDKELRPTGGFITAYSIAKVVKGRFDPTVSNDIYNLDNNYTPSIIAPKPIIDYIKGPYLLSNKLRLRDMNWSPDFSESMNLFSKEIAKAGIKNIDGIIAVDTQVLVNLLDVIGSVEVPGYGKFSNDIVSECNCPQVIYELESFADIEGPIVWSENEPGKIVFAPTNYDNRKKIIGPLMNSILSGALGQSNEKIPALFEAAIKSLSEKHVLFYLKNETAQEAVEEFGIGGVLKNYEGDYLFVNDANLGGRKSNLYVTQEVSQEVEINGDGDVLKTLTLTYKNPKEYDGWLNSVLPNWVRIYVPKGSELISIEGLEEKEEPYEEFEKTVFAGFFELRPQGIAKVVVKYKLPFKVKDEYLVYIQKQPGKDFSLYSFQVGGNETEAFLRSDKEFRFEI